MAWSANRTLLLNASYEPLQVISWQRAIAMTFLGKVEVVCTYRRQIRSVSRAMGMPAVVRLHDFVRRRRMRLGFSRRNIFVRDGNRCQYCGTGKSPQEMTCDHVLPRSQGGGTDWENMVACCAPCNRKKGGRTPEQAGMRLLRLPRRPEELAMVFRIKLGHRRPPDLWDDYLSWGERRRTP